MIQADFSQLPRQLKTPRPDAWRAGAAAACGASDDDAEEGATRRRRLLEQRHEDDQLSALFHSAGQSSRPCHDTTVSGRPPTCVGHAIDTGTMPMAATRREATPQMPRNTAVTTADFSIRQAARRTCAAEPLM